ncbi:MAG: hypothetical protein HYX59_09745 [Elusimicrobia bacterium]|nr:hypothetical protein [Elusimicrobiota bacterium]
MEAKTVSMPRVTRAVFWVGAILGGVVIFCQILMFSGRERIALPAVLGTYAVGLACIPTALILLGIGIHEKIMKDRIVRLGILLSAAGALICVWWLGALR